MSSPNMNTLYYGNDLAVLREHIKDESIGLVLLDQPLTAKRFDTELQALSPRACQRITLT
jgi:hypothetical protein